MKSEATIGDVSHTHPALLDQYGRSQNVTVAGSACEPVASQGEPKHHFTETCDPIHEGDEVVGTRITRLTSGGAQISALGRPDPSP